MRLLAILVCSFLLALQVHAQNDPYDLPIREHTYENGLRLLVLERPGDHRVACKIFTDFGALVETPGDLGSAHFLEHLMFKGTKTLGTKDWQAEAPIIEQIYATEKALILEMNKQRNELRQRGVFHDYSHIDSSPTIDSLHQELVRLNRKGVIYRDNGAMMRWYQGFGGTKLTASTEQEYMKFDINLPSNRVALFLRVEADRMLNSIFREFDQERMILVEQRFGDLNRPNTPYYEAMNALVSTIHPVFWPEGHLTDFVQYTRHYHNDLYKRYFIPNNTTLIFIGGVKLEDLIPQVDHYFGWMKRQPEPTRVKAIEPIPQAEKRMIWRSAQLSPRVEMRFLIPAVGHPDRPIFDVLSEVIEMELASSLKTAQLKGTANVNTRVVHTSRFGVPATLNIEVSEIDVTNISQIEQVMLSTFEQMKEFAVSETNLALAKKRLRTQWFRTALDADRLAFEIGHFQIMDRWQTLKPYLLARDATSLHDINRLTKKYLIEKNRSVGMVMKPTGASQTEEVAQ